MESDFGCGITEIYLRWDLHGYVLSFTYVVYTGKITKHKHLRWNCLE